MSAPQSTPSVRVSPVRARIEHASDPVLGRLRRVPTAALVAPVLLLVVVGVLVRGPVGAVCFGVVTLLLGWLLYLAWPRLEPLHRLMRASVLLLTAVLTLVMAVPR